MNLGRATRGERAFFLAVLSFYPIYGERDEGEARRNERDGRKKDEARPRPGNTRTLSIQYVTPAGLPRLPVPTYLFLSLSLSLSRVRLEKP